MGLRLKFNLVLLLVFVLGLGVTGYVSYELLHRNARDEVLRNAGRDDGSGALDAQLHRRPGAAATCRTTRTSSCRRACRRSAPPRS